MTVESKPDAIIVPKLFDPRQRKKRGAADGDDAESDGNMLDDLSTIQGTAVTEDLAVKLRSLHTEFVGNACPRWDGRHTVTSDAMLLCCGCCMCVCVYACVCALCDEQVCCVGENGGRR